MIAVNNRVTPFCHITVIIWTVFADFSIGASGDRRLRQRWFASAGW